MDRQNEKGYRVVPEQGDPEPEPFIIPIFVPVVLGPPPERKPCCMDGMSGPIGMVPCAGCPYQVTVTC